MGTVPGVGMAGALTFFTKAGGAGHPALDTLPWTLRPGHPALDTLPRPQVRAELYWNFTCYRDFTPWTA